MSASRINASNLASRTAALTDAAAPTKLGDNRLGQIRSAFQKKVIENGASITWKSKETGTPPGAVHRQMLFAEQRMGGYVYTAILPVGQDGDPNKSSNYYVERYGGKAPYSTQVAGPFPIKNTR